MRCYTAQGMPVISVDTKSRELIGLFHQSGRRWTQYRAHL
ncbi:MAG: ISAzo13-like element transposase-related protein [Planctomycetota bacterium]